MNFRAVIQADNPKTGVEFQDVLGILKGNDSTRIQGDLLMHSAVRGCSITVFAAEGYSSFSQFINKFYEQANNRNEGTWSIVFPCTLEFEKPMDGGLVLDFRTEDGRYPTYTGYSINT